MIPKIDAKVPKAEQEITRKMQHQLFNVIYATYIDDAKRLTTKEDVCEAYLKGEKINWDALPQNVKEVLIDLTYRGDYTGTEDKRGNTRKVIVPAVYRDQIENNSGINSILHKIMEYDSLWRINFQVDDNRYIKRMEHLE